MNKINKSSYFKLIISFLFTILFSSNFIFFKNNKNVFAKPIQSYTKQNFPKNNQGIGKFILKYEPTNSYEEIRQILVESKIFNQITDYLNNSGLIMRDNIAIVFQDCGDPNAYWNAEKKEIIICYENTAYDLVLFHENAQYPIEKAMEKSLNETIFAFYHELGHALIDILPLNAVGQEEDTVDEFASVMLYRNHDQNFAGEVILDSSEYYELLYKISEKSPSWDEHTPHDKRLFNLVCFVYGSDPEKYEKIFIEKFNLLDEEDIASEDHLKIRAAKCQQEFVKKNESWNRLLLPHYAIKNNYPMSPAPANNPRGLSERGIYW
ncbi:hypothetical protein GM3708_1075 [Geminocystis sp. NIES-3708]|uniref:DUF4344 domain-containing metallopeptidase n=1 Tax=Geminocystis sp. NIES-3708 TaxID=1615909 RepID=UPI0005FCA6B8|nr:DUF4344 domain-containing metallopeptidase [Geminocystis sp. NIES-3708]BAQ60669.1 hypothetical protein GM3708_1075 [Geminocystis sp. NIES-3708]